MGKGTNTPYKQNTVSKYISLTYNRGNDKQNQGWAIITMYVCSNIYEIHHEHGASVLLVFTMVVHLKGSASHKSSEMSDLNSK